MTRVPTAFVFKATARRREIFGKICAINTYTHLNESNKKRVSSKARQGIFVARNHSFEISHTKFVENLKTEVQQKMADTIETLDPKAGSSSDDSSAEGSTAADEPQEDVVDESVNEEEEVVYEDEEVLAEDEEYVEESILPEAGQEVADGEESASGSGEESSVEDEDVESEEADLEAAEVASRSASEADSSAKKADTGDGGNACITLICYLLFFAAITAGIAIPLRLRAEGGGTKIRSTSTSGSGSGGGGGGSGGGGVPTSPTSPSSPTATAPPGTAPTMAPAPGSTTPPTSVNLGQILETFLIPLFGEEPFQDPNSPTYKAADHLANNDPYIFSGPVTSQDELGDRYAATLLYYAVGGEGWANCGLGSATCTGNNWLEEDHCFWSGIECDEDTGRVRAVEVSSTFTGAGLTGSIPSGISLFTELEELVIEDEMLGGKLPTTLPAGLMNLSLSGNSLTGFVPDELLDLSALTTLDLSGNAMSGPLPLNMNQLVALETLSLSENDFSGTVPSTFADLENLSKCSVSS